jgi:hypothetical protein
VAELQGQIRVAVDGAGGRIDNSAVTIPAGTTVYLADGTTAVLSADTTFYRQRVVLADPEAPTFTTGVTKYGELRSDADVMRQARHTAEVQEFGQADEVRATMRTRQTERFTLTDRRGSVGRGATR